ncbi:MAG: methyltransferase domain-containing protein [Spirochaetales bacterium]|nr:methyltransferase domain-containing protein [Spirochaetales bacterium]
MSTQWNPDLYLRFQQERTQPSIDLVSRIELDAPRAVVDVGCGPGNSTQVLAKRWPASELTGVDSSEEMTAKARRDYPDRRWIHADVRDLPCEPRYDLVYSNATLQWIPDHETLIPHLFGMVRGPGALAVQIPLQEEMPVRQAIRAVAARARWMGLMAGISRLVVGSAGFYYDLLSPVARSVVIWQTAYIHEMDSHASIVTMLESTALRPYLARIDGEPERHEFLQEVTEEVSTTYPVQTNGHVLFPFHRLFFIAYRQ